VRAVILFSLLLFCWGLARECYVRWFLDGFLTGVVPLEGTPQQKVEAVLDWMGHYPGRRASEPPAPSDSYRDPVADLGHAELLGSCGTSATVLLAAADRLGMKSRRLLLVDENYHNVHVATELLIDGRWVVADAYYRTFLKDPRGRLLSKEELRIPQVFREATSSIPGYEPAYKYDRVVHINAGRVPVLGGYLRRALDSLRPGWDESPVLSQMASRSSLAQVVLSSLLLIFSLGVRLLLNWYGAARLGIVHVRLRDRLLRALSGFFSLRA
jgi:hypothetical protein